MNKKEQRINKFKSVAEIDFLNDDYYHLKSILLSRDKWFKMIKKNFMNFQTVSLNTFCLIYTSYSIKFKRYRQAQPA